MTVDRKKIVKPIHPGEILREEFLIPLNLSPIQLSKEIKVPKELVEWVYEERGDITVDLATRFSLFFGTSAEM
jgi:addiction module HigA family antidote